MFSLFILFLCYYFPSPSPLLKRNLRYKASFHDKENVNPTLEMVESVHHYIFQILFMSIILITFLWLIWVNLSSQVRYVSFNTNLSMYKNKSIQKSPCWDIYFLFIMLCLLYESGEDSIILLITWMNPNLALRVEIFLKLRNPITFILSGTIAIFMFSIAVTPVTQYFCLAIFQIVCHRHVKITPSWLSVILVLISNDIERNPGPEYHTNSLNFMSWNLNSLATNNFERVQLIEAHNTIFN